MKKLGLSTTRAEVGNFLGFDSPFSTTFVVLLDKNRLVSSKNVTFELDSEFQQSSKKRYSPTTSPTELEVGIPKPQEIEDIPPEQPEENDLSQGVDGLSSDQQYLSPAVSEEFADFDDLPIIDIEEMENPIVEPVTPVSDCSPPHSPESEGLNGQYWDLRNDSRPRNEEPQYTFMVNIEKLSDLSDQFDLFDRKLDEAIKELAKTHSDQNALHLKAASFLAATAQKDMSWKKALAGTDRNKAIEAFDKELASLESSILTRVHPGSKEYDIARQKATSGRFLLDIKRSGKYKARGIKQGFKEDKEQADGYDFNYYAHVAKLTSARTALFRPNRRGRRMALKDVSTAFLQSHKYGHGKYKFLSMKHPITGEMLYFRQDGPIYGEASAPARWENTIAPWLENEGFIRGENEKCVFYHPDRDLLLLLYVDDCLVDGEEEDIKWIFDRLDSEYDCKEAEWLSIEDSLDYLGMEISMDEDYIYLSMRKYISDTLKLLNFEDIKPVATPIHKEIFSDGMVLDYKKRKLFMTAVGCLGWLVNTGRPDVAYAHSRIAQHMANPTEQAWQAVRHVFAYLKGAMDFVLRSPLYKETALSVRKDSTPTSWQFFCDSDFAGNHEEQNKRRNQNGYIALQNEAPVDWSSKVSSVAFAHPDIGESHADISSGAAEIYAAANATYDILSLSYASSEMAINFPSPIDLQMDNSTAEVFVNDTAYKTKLKHIDVRQEWVRTLRNKKILRPVHVDTKINVADLFTKILPKHDFNRLRDMVMKPRTSV